MSEARIKAGIWVQAALRMGEIKGRYGTVIHKGDPDAGGILVSLRGEDGVVLLSQARDAEGNPAWVRAIGPEPVNESVADAYLARQRHFDPDLWVVEFLAPDYLPPFEARII
jgi:hypothetical protein